MRIVIATIISAGLAWAGNFTLSSSDLGGQLSMKQVFNGFGCEGENISPALQWKEAPEGTKSFALTMYDPDAPTGSGWWHWVVYNIPAATTEIAANASAAKKLPKGAVESVTSYGAPGFGGACPPVGDRAHRYIFTLYALNVESLDLGANPSPALVGYNLNAHAIEKSSIMAYYGRK